MGIRGLSSERRLLISREVRESLGAAGAVLEQYKRSPSKVNTLNTPVADLALPPGVADRHADCDAWSFFDEFGRFEAAPAPVSLFEEVDHLPAVPSGRRVAVDATARDAEPLRILDEQIAEETDVTAVEGGERLSKTIGAVAHSPKDTPRGSPPRRPMWACASVLDEARSTRN